MKGILHNWGDSGIIAPVMRIVCIPPLCPILAASVSPVFARSAGTDSIAAIVNNDVVAHRGEEGA